MSATPTIEATDVTTEAEALSLLATQGFFASGRDLVGQVEDFHWHEFDVVAYVFSGEAAAQYPDGTIVRAGPGTRAYLPAGSVHRDVPGSSARVVLGINIEPSKLTLPVNKPMNSQS